MDEKYDFSSVRFWKNYQISINYMFLKVSFNFTNISTKNGD